MTDQEMRDYAYWKAGECLKGQHNTKRSRIADAIFLEHHRGHLCDECDAHKTSAPAEPYVKCFDCGHVNDHNTCSAPGCECEVHRALRAEKKREERYPVGENGAVECWETEPHQHSNPPKKRSARQHKEEK